MNNKIFLVFFFYTFLSCVKTPTQPASTSFKFTICNSIDLKVEIKIKHEKKDLKLEKNIHFSRSNEWIDILDQKQVSGALRVRVGIDRLLFPLMVSVEVTEKYGPVSDSIRQMSLVIQETQSGDLSVGNQKKDGEVYLKVSPLRCERKN